MEDSNLLTALDLTETDIIYAILNQNVIGPAGTIGSSLAMADQALQLTVVTLGLLFTEKNFEEVFLAVDGSGEEVLVGDVARVEIGGESSGVA